MKMTPFFSRAVTQPGPLSERMVLWALSSAALADDVGGLQIYASGWRGRELPVVVHRDETIMWLLRSGLVAIAGNGPTARCRIEKAGRDYLNAARDQSRAEK